MNREEEFDARLARWLEDGPFEAPDRPIEAAIAHARAHPRRPYGRSALWRSAMAHLQLNPVPAPAHHLGRLFAVGIVAIAFVVIALIGTNVLKLNQPEPLPGIGVAPTATATVAPTASPVSSVKVTGTTTCTMSSGGTTTTTTSARGEVVQMREMVFTCDYSGFSDPRIRGTSNVNANVDEFSGDDDSGNVWGTEIMVTPNGHWSGSFAGIIDKGYGTHRIAAVLVGSGAYAGLQFRYTMTSENQGLIDSVVGMIEPVPTFTPSAPVTSPIAVSGTENCGDTFAGSSKTVGSVTELRGQVSTCDEQMSDPRVSAAYESSRLYDADVRADGSSNSWGVAEIPNSGGRWTGVWTGTTDTAGSNPRVIAAFVGSGGYAGLQYRLVGVQHRNTTAFTVTGTISPIK